MAGKLTKRYEAVSGYQTITALIANIIYVCALYQLLHGFLPSRRPFWQEVALYSAAYGVLTAVYLLWDIPLLTLLSNIVVILALSCCYPASWRQRLLAAAFVYSIVFLSETVVVKVAEARGFAHFTDFNNVEYLIVQILSKLLTFVLALWLAKLGRLKNASELPPAYWLALLAVPALTMAPAYVLLMTVDEDWAIGVAVSILSLFALNGFVLYLYERIIVSFQKELAQEAIREQNRMISRQLAADQEAMAKMRQLRHDWNNLLLPILGQLEGGDYERAEADLRALIANIGSRGKLVQGGDPILAAVINYKLTDIQAAGIQVHCQAETPDDLAAYIPVQMVGVLLGNLLDNAIRAVREDVRDTSEKYITVMLGVQLGVLIIVVANSFDGQLRIVGGQYQTTKNDPLNHGLGLSTISQIVDSQRGDMAIETSASEFKVRIKFFLNRAGK